MITTEGQRSFAAVRSAAKKAKLDVQKATTRFALERFVHRVFTSDHASRFALKGGMLMMFVEGAPDQYHARTTTDIDLHVQPSTAAWTPSRR